MKSVCTLYALHHAAYGRDQRRDLGDSLGNPWVAIRGDTASSEYLNGKRGWGRETPAGALTRLKLAQSNIGDKGVSTSRTSKSHGLSGGR